VTETVMSYVCRCTGRFPHRPYACLRPAGSASGAPDFSG
jgi:hypothetical protein